MPDTTPPERATSRAPSPSAATLPALAEPPATVLDYLCRRFPRVGRETWRQRMARGRVTTVRGRALSPKSPYEAGLRLFYYREVAVEPEVPGREEILFRSERILVADKPHFLPVTPGGPYVNECLVYRLRRRTGLSELTPIHRLDRATAGLVLFGTRREHLAPYSELFQEGRVEKEYLALAGLGPPPPPAVGSTWRIADRLERGEPFFRMAVAPTGSGPANAVTEVELLEARRGLGLFRLRPRTGKTHQLRVHMAGLGFPILGDRYYPELLPEAPPDFARPLCLLARRLAFRDPADGSDLSFESRFRLSLLPRSC